MVAEQWSDQDYQDHMDWEDGLLDEEPDEPFEEGPLYHEYVRVENKLGAAWFVDADDGEGNVRAHMVGDDRPFYFDASDLTILPREEFCGECGQIGCTHDGLERS